MNGTTMIIGAAGMLGRELVEACGKRGREIVAVDGEWVLDITDRSAVREAIREHHPAVIINAAAYTNVDGAESDYEAARAANADGPANLAVGCREAGALLVHYSTDYVFSGRGTRPYRPSDPTDPCNAYGRSKLAGEEAIAASGCEHLIIRTSWLYAAHAKNFVLTIRQLASERKELQVVDDQRGRPTYARDLAEATLDLIDADARGVFHATNDGECTWFEFAKAIVEMSELSCDVKPCDSSTFPRPAKRPAYSVLDLSDLTARIGPVRHWRDALRDCINRLDETEAGTASGARNAATESE